MQSIKIDEIGGCRYRIWKAPSEKAVLLLVHGLGAHTGRWEFLAEFFESRGISSYALELRGFGASPDLKGYVACLEIYLQDIRALLEIIRFQHSTHKVFLLGESLGGLIAFLGAAQNPSLFNGLICLSPYFKNRLSFTVLDYIKILLSYYLNPKKQFTVPFTSEMCTRDVAYQKAMDLNPFEHRLATAKLLVETDKAANRAKSLSHQIQIPTLFLTAGNDKIADSNAAKNVFESLQVQDKMMLDYPEMFHALSIDLGREKVFEDIEKWIKKRI